MSEQIEAGEGWRLIDNEKDAPIKGDQACCDIGRWVDRNAWDRPFSKSVVYRRRIPAKPEAMEIDHQTIKCNSFNEVMAMDEVEVWRLVSNAAEARQLADWLARYADWREAQDAGK